MFPVDKPSLGPSVICNTMPIYLLHTTYSGLLPMTVPWEGSNTDKKYGQVDKKGENKVKGSRLHISWGVVFIFQCFRRKNNEFICNLRPKQMCLFIKPYAWGMKLILIINRIIQKLFILEIIFLYKVLFGVNSRMNLLK